MNLETIKKYLDDAFKVLNLKVDISLEKGDLDTFLSINDDEYIISCTHGVYDFSTVFATQGSYWEPPDYEEINLFIEKDPAVFVEKVVLEYVKILLNIENKIKSDALYQDVKNLINM